MIYKNGRPIGSIYHNGRAIKAVYKGLRLLFNKVPDSLIILSCFANGYWNDEYPWVDDHAWVD